MMYRDIFGTFYRRVGNHTSYFNTNIRTVQSQIGIFKKSDCSSKCSWFSMMLQIVNISDLGLDILYDFAPDWNGGKYSKLRYWSMMIYGSVERFCPYHLKRIHVLIIIIIKEKVLSCQNSLFSLVKEEYIICDSCAYHLNRQI